MTKELEDKMNELAENRYPYNDRELTIEHTGFIDGFYIAHEPENLLLNPIVKGLVELLEYVGDIENISSDYCPSCYEMNFQARQALKPFKNLDKQGTK